MARQPQVTRTITTTKAAVLCLDLVTKQPFEKIVVLPHTYKDNKKLFKMVENLINSDEVKAVHVIATETEETLYGMSEQKFIENADILPPRN